MEQRERPARSRSRKHTAQRPLLRRHTDAGLHALCLPASARDRRAYAQPHSKHHSDTIAYTDGNPYAQSHVATVANAFSDCHAPADVDAVGYSDINGYSDADCDCHAEAYAQAPSVSRAWLNQ
jgi:hypothetical protein